MKCICSPASSPQRYAMAEEWCKIPARRFIAVLGSEAGPARLLQACLPRCRACTAGCRSIAGMVLYSLLLVPRTCCNAAKAKSLQLIPALLLTLRQPRAGQHHVAAAAMAAMWPRTASRSNDWRRRKSPRRRRGRSIPSPETIHAQQASIFAWTALAGILECNGSATREAQAIPPHFSIVGAQSTRRSAAQSV